MAHDYDNLLRLLAALVSLTQPYTYVSSPHELAKDTAMRNPRIERAADSGDRVVTAFEDEDVVRAYQHRPPYSADVIAMLRALSGGASGAVLDVGCGRGELARRLAPYVNRVDTVDRSAAMIEAGWVSDAS